MSFAPANLAVLAYANTFSLWHYETEDGPEQLAAPGYFNAIAKLLRRGDLIFVSRSESAAADTALLLVTEVSEETITIQSLETGGAFRLDALNDVRLERAEAEQVLTYDGGRWVNRPNPGSAGDAHAALRGNPHGTSAADVGAVPLAEKGQPDGVATLDADGSVPAAQLRQLALANLQEILASKPELGDVIKYDGRTWVTEAEAGRVGDAFAASHAGSVGTAHGVASVDAAGFMSAEDKQKLDGVAELAEPNPPVASDAEAIEGDASAARIFSPAQIRLAINARLDRWGSTVQVPNSRLAPVPTGTFKGRASPGSGDVEDLSAGEARRLLNVEDGAVAAGVLGDAHARAVGNPHLTTAFDIGAVPVAEKGAPGGVAALDDNGRVPAAQLPPLAGGAVASVFGRTGVIVAQTDDYSADQIKDTPAKVLMTAEERSKLSSVENGATAAGVAGDAFASAHTRAGSDAHAPATATAAGFMSPADKEKLDGIAPGAAPTPAVATQEEVAAGTGSDPRLLTPALIKQAVISHAPPAAADSVTNVALANMAPARIKGRATGAGIGDPQDLTPVQVRTIINVADGATAAGALGDSHASAIGNPHQTSAEQVGAVPAAEKGAPHGVATLDATGKVPAAQLPPGSSSPIATVFGRTGAIVAQADDYSADQIKDTASKVLMTAEERSKLSRIEPEATAAGRAGDAFAAAHAGSGGGAHAAATPTEAGFMSALDKQKLDGVSPLAAANPLVATAEEIAAGTGAEPRLLTPAQIKQAVVAHTPPPAPDTIDNVALANMSPARLKGRAAGAGIGDPQDLTPAQARTLLNVADGAAPTPPTLDDADIIAGTATAVGSVTAAKLKLAAVTHGKGSAAFKTIAVSGQPSVPAVTAEDTLNLVAGANVTLTTDPSTKSVTIAASPTGGPAANAFGEIYVAGKPPISAKQSSARLELKAGPGIALSNDPASNCVTFSTISLGASNSYWNAANPSIGETSPGAGDGGLKTSNSAAQNKAVFTDLFEKMAAAPADNMFLQVPAGTYDLVGSISPSGRNQDFTTGSRLTVLFERCVFRFVGNRADYNQVQYDASGWKTLDTFPIASKKPFKRGNVVSGRPIPFLDSKGYPRPHCVLFDVSRCSSGDKGIDVRGYLELKGPNGSTSAGFVGIGPGRAHYGFAKGSTWDAVKITSCSVGLLSLYITQAGEVGDGFTSSQWNLLDIRNGTRAFVLDSNSADMMSIGKATFSCQDTAYIYRTHVNIGSAFFATTTPSEISLTSPNPKIFECMGTLNIGALYARGDKAPTRAWSVINVANEGVVSIGCLHGDSNHDSQSGAHITLAMSDNNHPSLAGSITIGGTGTDTTTSPIACVVGVAPVAGAKRYVNAVAINVPGGGKSAPPVAVIPDYGSDLPAAVNTNDYLTSFSFNTGFSQQKIAGGVLANY